MKAIRIILPTLMIVISIVAIVLSGVAIGLNIDYQIMDAYEIGLKNFIEDEVYIILIQGTICPKYEGVFYDEEFLKDFRNLISTSTYQIARNPNYESRLLQNGHSSIVFVTARARYRFSVLDKVLIIDDAWDQPYFYYSNMTINIDHVICDKYTEYLQDELPLIDN